ncbi:DUF1292 domain-containing protein [Sutcliffiella horikoshii]|uniref:DUF1292 domain-containing protein n=1 Tax=Sutcliffiella horikoshii TaxID=79883 RepID=A0A1Y0CMK4_9BACI|nr:MULTISPECIES: DUF1292 domain-containing protein [Bacillaceae]ART76518.1 DUF1292 domain-containing protein [Sutcliffiella horikoshii]TYS57789.1 DUF1292 domain-containing protein [Sutcliffiella horikoshii]TYS73021.1 DUF1292 domain-containing protein [Sutcliffiella horikoshii]
MEKIEVGDIFIVTDENDQEQELEVLGTMDVADSVYVAVGFVEEIAKETTGDVDIFFLKVEEDGELSEIETDEEFNEVSAAFEAMVDKEQ